MMVEVGVAARKLVVLVTVAALGVVGCGDSDSGPPYEVVITEISHETTQEMAVFAPDADGSWPVVFTLHGAGGEWEDMAETSRRIAERGMVVFSATYRSDERTGAVLAEIEQDVECAYRFGRSIAADYGGDLGRPVTIVGHSLGSSAALEHGLGEATYGPDGTFATCFAAPPRPDVIVGIAGCYIRNGFNMSRYESPEATLDFVAAADDDICAASESESAIERLQDAGYDATFSLIDDANHFTPIFHDKIDGEWVLLPDEPAGERTVQTVLDAIAQADA